MNTSARQALILLIDDTVADLRILSDLLALSQMRFSVADNGADGYQRAILQQPDLIMLDVQMPGMDGFEVCRLLKDSPHTRHIPVIFLTAVTEPAQRVAGLTLGAVDYVCKPFHEHEVMARIKIHLQLARPDPTPVPNYPAALTPRDDVLVQVAIAFLRQHLANPPSTHLLAQHLGTHEKRVSQAFRVVLSMTVSEWHREERLRQACQMLTSSACRITDISAHLGYSSPANFSKAFGERFGCSPSQLRQSVEEPWNTPTSTLPR